MAVFAVTYAYGPDTDHRMSVRPAHRAWQKEILDAGILLASGPLEDEQQPGGLLLLTGENAEAIAELLAHDPYAEAGVIESTTIRTWNPVFGPWSE
ncbi:YciI family protein [Brevibacterium samyangense]|uniref:YCII-related domain-containing protein n=1 Tax=Brevibacterium samyangense TaxID=366888 RepID=A0ABP5EX50_9MICO